jgi:hypothetical protein
MRQTKSIILFYFICLLTSCDSLTDEINKAFHTVNNSIQNSNKYLDNSIDKIFDSIKANRHRNLTLASKADTLFYKTENTIKFIDSLKQLLELQDTSGNDLKTSSKLLVMTLTSNNLKDKLVEVYKYSYLTLNNNKEKAILDSVANSIIELQFDKEWSKKYFYKTPTVAAITILTKFENVCKNSAIIGMSNIRKQLVEK